MTRVPVARICRADAMALATRKFRDGERLDIGQLANELGINRVTLHRWIGTRDALIVEVVWPLAEATMRQAWATVEGVEGARVPRLIGEHLRASMAQGPVQRFVREENERAMKIFTQAAFGYQPRMVAMLRDYLELDIASGRISSPLSLDELAYATERIAESYAYLPTITGEEPDPASAERVLDAFLGSGALKVKP